MDNDSPLIKYSLEAGHCPRLLKCINALNPELNLLKTGSVIIPIWKHKEVQYRAQGPMVVVLRFRRVRLA